MRWRVEKGDVLGWTPSLTCDTIDIYEWMEFDFYGLVWFWNNHSDYSKPMLVQWLGVSPRVESTLCYRIISEKGKVLSRTTVQNITAEKLRDPNVK